MFTYIVQSGWEQSKLLSSRRPIEEVIKDPSVDGQIKQKLKLALEVRKFAEAELGFKPSKNYQTYVDLQRPYVTWIVTAAYKNRLEAYQWHYPIVGKMPYKGYFIEEDAHKEAKKFAPLEYDTWVRGVSAYSTLGWFQDPILSSMLRGDDPDIVELVLHESAHATLFIKGHADFNERLATFLGTIGTKEYYQKKDGPEALVLKSIAQRKNEEKIFSEFISHEVRSLKTWYEENKNHTERDRDQRLLEINMRFKKNIAPQIRSGRYHYFGQLKLNNAVLLGFNTYVYDLSDFEKLLQKNNGDIKSFLAACAVLVDAPDPNSALKALVLDSP
jgi:predicted aminopeptidase